MSKLSRCLLTGNIADRLRQIEECMPYLLDLRNDAWWLHGDYDGPIGFSSQASMVQAYSGNTYGNNPSGRSFAIFSFVGLPSSMAALALFDVNPPGANPDIISAYQAVLYMAPSQLQSWAWFCIQKFSGTAISPGPVVPVDIAQANALQYVAVTGNAALAPSFNSCLFSSPQFSSSALQPLTM